jgi:carboxyl-terminal processing protease
VLRLDNKYNKASFIWLIAVTLLLNIFTLAGFCFGADITQNSMSVSNKTTSIANLICSGKFVAAKELLTTETKNNGAGIGYLADIISEYETIEKKRHTVRANSYQEQLDKIEKFRIEANLEDTNDITDMLQVILEVSEYATKTQREALFEDVLVKKIIKKAIIKAEELDANGQWLEAYKRYYWWLENIAPENSSYTDRAKQLIDKAEIKASLQDSPCETCDERYAGVEPLIFIEAINTLDMDYVVRITDYSQMVLNAINRCELLVEVLSESNSEISKNEKMLSLQGKKDFKHFSTTLEALADEINISSEAISKEKFIDIFEEVLVLNATTVKLPRQVLIAQFAEGALSALDQHTIVIWPNQVSDFEKRLNGKFSGIGITFLKERGSWIVSGLLSDTPAYKSGLNVGDAIEAVDGVEAKEMTADCMIKKITGPVNTPVTLTIKSSDKNKISILTITRTNVTIPSVHGWQRATEENWRYMIDSHYQIGYIRIVTFTEETVADFEKVLSMLEPKGLKGLVIDLRSNPGGVVTAAAEIVDKFVDKGMIVSTCPRYGMATYLSAHKEDTHPDYPVVILTNKTSASASEIVAGALQDPKYKRAILVGEKTFGKGSVQNIKHLSGNAKLKYTMAYYRLPSGQRVGNMEMAKKVRTDNWGVSPDIEVELNTEEYKKLVNVQKSNEALRGNNNHVAGDMKYYSSQDTIEADPQLAIGLLVLRGKIVQKKYLVALN